MAELLLELFSEEIPARMQGRAAEDLRRLVTEGLKAQGLEAGEAKAFATPRRLTLVVEGVPAKSPDISEERKGPRVNAPEQAIAGFVKSAGLTSIKDATVVKDEKKGDFYVVKIEKPRPGGEGDRRRGGAGRGGEVSVAEVDALGLGPHARGCGRCIRSCCLLDGKVVPFEIEDVESGKETRGHRFHGNEPFEVDGRGRLRQGPQEAQGDPRCRRAQQPDRRAGAGAGQGTQAGAGRGRGAARPRTPG